MVSRVTGSLSGNNRESGSNPELPPQLCMVTVCLKPLNFDLGRRQTGNPERAAFMLSLWINP
jgi:hypothetical protein